ncbi:MAG: glutamate synthase [Deltaproteobacteria bacterium RBG_13_61_14]|nr:MAG: glutamate synthase [Deltaproteobacteria bacterium RBG_13_61_14]
MEADPEPGLHPRLAALVAPCPSRFRNPFGKYKAARSAACHSCGKCAEVCAYGVHIRAGKRVLAPRSQFCRGPEFCRAKGEYCVDHCPELALRVGPDPMFLAFGDPRWTAALLVSTWIQAETGRPPAEDLGLEDKVGASGGGFDRMDFLFPRRPALPPEAIDLRLPLNRRDDGRPQVTIGFPVYGGGMSFGSISLATMIARARAYQAFDSFTCTGEGGFPEELTEYDDHVITQVATGLFGVREETIQRVRIVELKYAQGAKPGLGGHLLGDKVTPAVAKMREAVEGSSLFSPFPFHSVYSVEDHKKHVDWVKHLNPKALVAVKVSTPTDVDMVAVGSYYAGAHILHLDGSYGGTGAAPDIAKKNIAMPIEYAIPKVHRFLIQEGVRDQITLIASGGIRTAWDMAKAIALGADGVVLGTAELVALECIRCGNCESGRGCPRGIATTDPELAGLLDPDWAAQRIINLFHSYCLQLREILWRLGMQSVRELTGRSDLLTHFDFQGREPELEPARKSA